jgi:hypothetical protein
MKLYPPQTSANEAAIVILSDSDSASESEKTGDLFPEPQQITKVSSFH